MSTHTVVVQATRYRDDRAYADYFRRHYARVYQVLYRLVGDEADDLAQDVFLGLYHHMPLLEADDVGAWLYRVATRVGYNALRSAKRQAHYRDVLASAPENDGWQGAEADPEAWTVQRETQRLVRTALGKLGQRQAALLTLRASGLSYRELAAALRVAPGSVGTLLARAERSFEREYTRLLGDRAETGGEP